MSADTSIINQAKKAGDNGLSALFHADRGTYPAISIETDSYDCLIVWSYCDLNRLVLALKTQFYDESHRWHLDARIDTGTKYIKLALQYGISEANQHLMTYRMPDFTETADMTFSDWRLSLQINLETQDSYSPPAKIAFPLVVDTTHQILDSQTPDSGNHLAEIHLKRAVITPSQMRFYLQHQINGYSSGDEWLSVGHVTAGHVTNQAGLQRYLPDKEIEELVFNQSAGQTETMQLVIEELVPAKSTKRKYPDAQRLRGSWIFSLNVT